ncbi:MAG TPA: PEP-CTERM sorting domain-containing protein, partial [Planctomycetes bacterium]|nr:PEP-CTERM sorting domain-containing protein [Planctomycetota bacterium]
TELSVDGGATWIPANDSIRMVLVIPEPATIAILALGALMMSRKH